MTGFVWLDWALISVSTFNTFLLLALGLTVLLNAERRGWGVWVMGGGLLMGAAFFVSHTAILGHELAFTRASLGLDFWWRVGWVPVIVAPYAWYLVMLWYAGFWSRPEGHLRRRHRFPFWGSSALAAFLVLLVIVGNPLPGYLETVYLDFSGTPAIYGIPVLFILFPVLMLLTVLCSLDALRWPEPSERVMGDLARQRSRPWLLATSAVLLLVGLLVTAFIVWILVTPLLNLLIILLMDLLMAALIGLSVILLGQAIVAYEVFTGRALPRRGFARQWRNTLLLSAGYSLLVGWVLALNVRPVYSLMLTAVLTVTLYALFNWRQFRERERFMANLRPFVGSDQPFQRLLAAADRDRADVLFETICRDVLGTGRAWLVPGGSLAPLVGRPLSYPPGAGETPPDLLRASSSELDGVVRPIRLEDHPDLRWAIPLWSDRGSVGALLLGDKLDGSLYTQEEIEIARSAGERMVETLAGEEMTRRLMALQRGRLAESRVMDRRTRRTLHDETLPALHTALLRLNPLAKDDPAAHDALQSLADVHHQLSDLIHTARAAIPSSGGGIGAALRELVESEFAGEFSSVKWALPSDEPVLDGIAQEVLIGAAREAIRNAALHGRGDQPDRPLNLSVTLRCSDGLSLVIGDDGVGFGGHLTAVSNPSAGTGSGLALHSTMLAIVGGYLSAESSPGGGTQVTITLPGVTS